MCVVFFLLLLSQEEKKTNILLGSPNPNFQVETRAKTPKYGRNIERIVFGLDWHLVFCLLLRGQFLYPLQSLTDFAAG